MKLKLPALPGLKLPLAALVITGGAPTLALKVWVVLPAPLLASRVTV